MRYVLLVIVDAVAYVPHTDVDKKTVAAVGIAAAPLSSGLPRIYAAPPRDRGSSPSAAESSGSASSTTVFAPWALT